MYNLAPWMFLVCFFNTLVIACYFVVVFFTFSSFCCFHLSSSLALFICVIVVDQDQVIHEPKHRTSLNFDQGCLDLGTYAKLGWNNHNGSKIFKKNGKMSQITMRNLVYENHIAMQLKFKNHFIKCVATMFSKVQLLVKFTHYKYGDLINKFPCQKISQLFWQLHYNYKCVLYTIIYMHRIYACSQLRLTF